MRLRGHSTGYQVEAIAGVDIAPWDLAGKLVGLPVYRLLGGPYRAYWRDDARVEAVCDRYPFEFSVPLADPSVPFRFRLGVVDNEGQRHDSALGELAVQ